MKCYILEYIIIGNIMNFGWKAKFLAIFNFNISKSTLNKSYPMRTLHIDNITNLAKLHNFWLFSNYVKQMTVS